MTKLFDALVAHNTGRLIADIQPVLLKVEDGVGTPEIYNAMPVYQIHCTIGAHIAVPHQYLMEDFKRKAWAQINHHVYGEFRPDLDAIREALNMRDIRKAEDALETLYKNMFSV